MISLVIFATMLRTIRLKMSHITRPSCKILHGSNFPQKNIFLACDQSQVWTDLSQSDSTGDKVEEYISEMMSLASRLWTMESDIGSTLSFRPSFQCFKIFCSSSTALLFCINLSQTEYLNILEKKFNKMYFLFDILLG